MDRSPKGIHEKKSCVSLHILEWFRRVAKEFKVHLVQPKQLAPLSFVQAPEVFHSPVPTLNVHSRCKSRAKAWKKFV